MQSFVPHIEKLNRGLDYVLAIIVDSQGSTYRKCGAMMLIDQSLHYYGILSGGHLEDDILRQSESVFELKRDKIVCYSTRDNTGMLDRMGSHGELTILLKYLPLNKKHCGLFNALEHLDKGKNCFLVLKKNTQNRVDFVLSLQNDLSKSKLRNDWKTMGSIHLPIKAPIHLLICGGTPDATPLTALAKQLGWKTTIVDHRKRFADKRNFPDANYVNHLKSNSWSFFDLSIFDYAIIMSHHYDKDKNYLAHTLHSSISYIGLLGPKTRRDKLLNDCKTDFNHQEGRIFAPVGLDIGANSPETIALAILAEIMAVRNNKKISFCYQDSHQ